MDNKYIYLARHSVCMSQAGQTWTNAVIGAVVTTIAYFVPVLNAIAPIFGGFVAGYLQKRGAGGGMKVGGLKGVVMTVPAIGLGVIAGSVLAGMPVVGELLAGSVAIVVVVVVLHSVVIGLVGGLFGGLLAGNEAAGSATATTS